MITFTIEPDQDFAVSPGIKVTPYAIADKTFIGVDVGNFSNNKQTTDTPILRIFRIRYAKPDSVVNNVTVNTRNANNEAGTPQLISADALINGNDTNEQALVYINARDPERKTRLMEGKKHYLTGSLYEGTLSSTQERVSRNGEAYFNKCNPCVLIMKKDEAYNVQYFDGKETRIRALAFDGTNVVTINDIVKPRPARNTPAPRKPKPLGANTIGSMIQSAAYDGNDVAAEVMQTWKEHRKQRRKDKWSEGSRKEKRWK